MNSSPRGRDSRPAPVLVAAVAGGLTAALGAAVLVAWYLRLDTWIRIRAGLTPMVYNTALCFIAGGAGLLAAQFRRRRVTAAAGALVGAVSLAKLAEYGFRTDFGLDRLLFDAYPAGISGRMAPNTAACFALTAAALVVSGLGSRRRARSLLAGVAGAIVSALGAVALFGYATGIEPTYGWGPATRMSLLAAAGFAVFGAGLVASAWGDCEAEPSLCPPWLPLLVGIAVATGTLALWQALWSEERAHVTRTIRLEEEAVRNELAARLESRVLALVRLARQWERHDLPHTNDRPRRVDWEPDAALLVRQYPGLRVAAWVDPSLRARWVVPLERNEALLSLDARADPRRSDAFAAARTTRDVVVSAPLDLGRGGKGFLVCVPLFRADRFGGFVVGAFQVSETFDGILANVARGYSIVVLDGQARLYSRPALGSMDDPSWGDGTPLAVKNASWRVRVRPRAQTLVGLGSAAEEMLLGAGLLTALMLALSVRLAQTGARQARQAGQANRHLRAEVVERARAEEAARQSERLLAQVLETLPVGVWILDREGRITRGNPAGRAIWGGAKYVGPEGYGEYKAWRRGSGTPIEENEWAAVRAISRGETTLDEELAIEAFDGGRRVILHSVAPIRGLAGEVVGAVVVNYDRTDEDRMKEEILRANAALGEAEARYRALVEHIPAVTYRARADEPGRADFVSPQIEALLGFSPEEWIADPGLWLRQVHADDRERVLGELERSRQSGIGLRCEYRLVSREGRPVWVRDEAELVRDPSGTMVYCQGVLLDVTERRATEEALRESEERLRDFFEEDLSGAFISTPEGEILFCNSAFVRMFGFESMQEALEASASSFYRPGGRQQMLELLHKRGKLEHYAVEFVRRDGTTFPAIANIAGKVDTAGELIQLKGFLFDDTEHRRLEDQLRQAQKLESVGTLVAGIAHDFNNILTGMMGRAELAAMNLPQESGAREDLELIFQLGRRAATLIARLMAFSRRDVPEKKPLALGSVVTETAKILQRTLPETIAIHVEVPEGLPCAHADVTQVQQVLMNLCVNARDAMPDGGTLDIALTRATLDDEYCLHYTYARPGEYLCLSVRDTGVGMAPEVQERVFEPFFTTKAPGAGTGLGLAMVYGIVKSHDGFVNLYSEVGLGTQFRVYLPAYERAAESSPRVLEKIRGGSEAVLLVEDDPHVREVTALLLRKLGYEVHEAENGEDALRLVADRAAAFHAVLADSVMPRMGGLALAQALFNRGSAPPMVLMSGYASATDHDARKAAGVRAFVQKPVVLRELAATLRAVLDDGCAPGPDPGAEPAKAAAALRQEPHEALE